MKASIKNHLMLTILGSTLIVGLILSTTLILLTRSDLLSLSEQHLSLLEQSSTQAFEDSLSDTVENLSATLVNPVYYSEFSMIEQLLQAATSLSRIESIYLIDTEGNLLHEGSPNFTRMGMDQGIDDSLIKKIEAGENISLRTDDGIQITRGIFLGDQLLAILRLQSNPLELVQAIENTQDQLTKNSQELILVFSITALALTLGLMLLSGVASWILADRLAKPINALQAQAKQMGSGDLKIDGRIDRADEIGDLANSIYAMAADLELQNRSVKYLAFHDPLTGIANRSSFQMDLEDQIVRAAEHNISCALMFIDIDDFKDVNDSRGHDLGDRTLKTLADRISDVVYGFFENSDFHPSIARIGGDEFTVILPGDKGERDLREIAERILESTAKPIPLDSDMQQISASIGISRYPRDGISASMLLNAADTAMYNSKSAGKGTYRFFEETMIHEDHSSQQIQSDFKQAIDQPGELQLLYQPIANIRSGAILGGEALMRWNHPKMGPLEPVQFISVVENNEIALAADLWVISSTLEFLASMDLSKKPNFVISANISASNLGREQFPEAVARIIRQSPVDPKHLQLEITETYLHRDESKALQSLQALQQLGIKLWLDDFCTGYSSLKHLHMFPVNGIKIDRQFVISISNSNEDRLLVSAMASLAHSFNIGVVAEGIDNQADRELLLTLKCEMGQGDLFSPPLQGDAFVALVNEGKHLPLEKPSHS